MTTTEQEIHPIKRKTVNFYEVAARARRPDLEGLSWSSLRAEGFVVKVGFSARGAPYKSGKRKGEKRYVGEEVFEYVTPPDVMAAKDRYRRETGLCHECFGSGHAFARWDHKEGTSYKPCAACTGTGLAAVQP